MVIIKTLNTQEENSTMERLPQDWSTLLLSIINIIFFIILAQYAPFYCARHDGIGERLCNHWLNYFTKQRNLYEISFPYKEYLSAAIEIKKLFRDIKASSFTNSKN